MLRDETERAVNSELRMKERATKEQVLLLIFDRGIKF